MVNSGSSKFAIRVYPFSDAPISPHLQGAVLGLEASKKRGFGHVLGTHQGRYTTYIPHIYHIYTSRR